MRHSDSCKKLHVHRLWLLSGTWPVLKDVGETTLWCSEGGFWSIWKLYYIGDGGFDVGRCSTQADKKQEGLTRDMEAGAILASVTMRWWSSVCRRVIRKSWMMNLQWISIIRWLPWWVEVKLWMLLVMT